MDLAAPWVKKVGQTESCNFSTDNCKFPADEIWVFKTQFRPYIPAKWGTSSPKFRGVRITFSDKKKILRRVKIYRANCPLPGF